MSTHAIVDSNGNAKKVGVGTDLFPLLQSDYPYSKGFRVVPIDKVNTTQDGNTVSAVSLERQARIEAKLTGFADKLGLESNGFVRARPVVPVGTRITEDGDGRFIESKLDYGNRPLIEDACATIGGEVKAEHRQDVKVDLREIRMLPTGELIRCSPNGIVDRTFYTLTSLEGKGLFLTGTNCKSGGATCLEVNGMASLLSHVPGLTGMGRYFRDDLDPVRRSVHFNDAIERMPPLMKGDKEIPREVVLRTRNGHGPRRIYAAVSTGYGVFDVDQISDAVGEAFRGRDMRGAVTYDPATTKFRAEAGWHAERVVDFGAGDAFRCGVWIESGDARNSGCNGGVFIERNVCKNFVILTYDQVRSFSIRHIGRGFAEKVHKGIDGLAAQAEELWQIFAADWHLAEETKIVDVVDCTGEVYSKDPQVEMMSQVYDMTDLDRVISRDVAVEVLLGGWKLEPGDNWKAVINAVTRAHDRVPVEIRPAFEKAGGDLLMAGRG